MQIVKPQTIKIRLFVLVLFLQISTFTFSQTVSKRISISNPTEEVIQLLDQKGIDLTCGAIVKKDKIHLELSENELFLLDEAGISYDILINDLSKFYSERAINDLPKASLALIQEKIKSKIYKAKGIQSKSITEIINNVGQYTGENELNWVTPSNWKLNDGTNYPSETNHFGGCLTFDMVKDELDLMKSTYPNLISAKVNASPSDQKSYEGRTVWMVRISDNPETDESEEPETLYQSLIHSREAATIMNQLYFMWYLLENYDSDPAIKNLVNNHALYFIPVFNPDGFAYNQTVAPNGGGGQRKNRNTSGGCGTYAEGIDLNRNSGYYWGNGGASSDSCSATYRGTGAFSENETQIMRDFFLEHDFKLALNHHSYKNAMLHAYAGTAKVTNPRPDEYPKYSHDFSFYNRYLYGPSSSITSINSGNMNDWMLGGPAGTTNEGFASGTGSGKHTMSWTPENGSSSEGTGGSYGGFWPQPSNYLPIAKRAMRMNFMAAYFSGKYAKLHDLTSSNINGDGNLSFAIENLGQNGSDLTPLTNKFTLTVTAVSSNITITSPGYISENFTEAQILEQRNVNIAYTLDAGIQPNDKIEYKVILTNDYASDNILYEANIVKYYEPTELFSYDSNSITLNNWTGTWSVTSDGYLGSNAVTASSAIPYANNQTKTVQMDGSVDLTGISKTLVQFKAKWDLERSFDYVQIQGSTNGTTWTPLQGQYTKPGSPNEQGNTYYSGVNYNSSDYSTGNETVDGDFQPDWQPLYDGDSQDKWVMEEIVIDASTNSFLFNQSTVYFKFIFKTDAYGNRKDSYYNADFEGFTFDDFRITGVSIPCVTTTPLNLSTTLVTTVNAVIEWDFIPSATYDIQYKETSLSTWTEITDISVSNYTISGLNPSTNYEVQVRSRCTSSTSTYSTSVNFTTNAIVPCVGTVISDFSVPYTESFESGIGNWVQGSSDDFEWTINSNETTSTGTGPSIANDGNNYIYVEASNPNFPLKTANLDSPCFDLFGYKNAQISFDINMIGVTMGSLNLKVSIDNGDNYTEVFSVSGNQSPDQATWMPQSVNLAGYSGQTIKLMFEGITGSDWSSDIAIDNISFTAEVDSSLGIEDEILSTFQLYPNPSSIGKINVRMPNEIQEFTISISNVLGQKLYESKMNSDGNNMHSIETSNFKTGIYFVNVSTNLGSATKKIIIQ